MEIVLYSTGCPKCRILETKLKQKNIKYDIVEDVDIIQKKGILSVPALEINGQLKNFSESFEWVNNIERR